MSDYILISVPLIKAAHVWRNFRYEHDFEFGLYICWDGLIIPVSYTIDINLGRTLTFYFKNEYKDQAFKFKLIYG